MKESILSSSYDHAVTQLKKNRVDHLPELDTLIQIVADFFHCACVGLSLSDDSTKECPQNLIASIGMKEKSITTPFSFCRFVYEQRKLVTISDALEDDHFMQNEYLVQKGIHFCAGCPIELSDGDIIGALCIFDTSSKEMGVYEKQQLHNFSQVVGGLLRSNINLIISQMAIEEMEKERQLSSRQQALFEEVAKVSGVGGWEFDVESNELFWTKQTREIVGVNTDFKPTLDAGFSFFAPEAREIIEDTVNNALSSNGIWASELPFINAQGKHMWVKTTGLGIYENGELCRLIGAFQDVSDRKLIEQKMSENERLILSKNKELSAILNHIPQGVAVYDSNGRLKYWNNQHVKIYEKSPDQIYIRQHFVEFLMMYCEHENSDIGPEQLMLSMNQAFEHDTTLRHLFYLKSGKIVEALYSKLPDDGWICTSEDITEQEKSREKIHYAAHHDILTGLANRSLFNDYVDTLSDSLADTQQHILMLIDLDHFKAVNDTYGHSIGDSVLKDVAQRLTSSVRETDLVCRLGGDEFAIILSGQDNLMSIATKMAKRIVELVSMPYSIGDNLEVKIGVSIGLSEIDKQDIKLNEALKQADKALYTVKREGRNNYLFY
ncbi:diguanylate cyclase domain-containing protein [Vibrio viridaestus]|uniref:diguanylate cyclase domain-containing protein n=1 Tax=Vibrio viridaestus TaxID=2487322 RepID=UPI00140D206F|nr:diguanylate cyclase [Vibrio viridaestus]